MNSSAQWDSDVHSSEVLGAPSEMLKGRVVPQLDSSEPGPSSATPRLSQFSHP